VGWLSSFLLYSTDLYHSHSLYGQSMLFSFMGIILKMHLQEAGRGRVASALLLAWAHLPGNWVVTLRGAVGRGGKRQRVTGE
jgi:hypothetical protein